MKKADFDRAAELLNIVESVSKVAPQFTAISGEAMAELKVLNDELFAAKTPPKPVEPAKPLVDNPTPSKPLIDPTKEARMSKPASGADFPDEQPKLDISDRRV